MSHDGVRLRNYVSYRLASLLVVLALVAGGIASTASASRRPSAGERQAIRASAEAWLKKNLEPTFLKTPRSCVFASRPRTTSTHESTS